MLHILWLPYSKHAVMQGTGLERYSGGWKGAQLFLPMTMIPASFWTILQEENASISPFSRPDTSQGITKTMWEENEGLLSPRTNAHGLN